MAQMPGRTPPSIRSPTDIHPDDFEKLVDLNTRYTEDVVNRALKRAVPEARRRSLTSGPAISAFSAASRSPSQLEYRAGSAQSSPQVGYRDDPRFSTASTSSSYSYTSAKAESGHSGFLVPPAPAGGRLRNRQSDPSSESAVDIPDSASRTLSITQLSGSASDPFRRRQEAAKNYVCTYCNKDFGGKSDWKRHETTFHEPQYVWHCPVCNRSFNSKRKFSTHHARDHDCGDCDHTSEAQKTLPNKTAFGCGFQSCSEVLYSWDERCNHVAKHFEEGEIKQNWHYSNTIKNLLRQEKLADSWSRMLSDLYGPREVWPQLIWRLADTRELKEQLEYGGFGSLTELLQEAHQTGLAGATSDPSTASIAGSMSDIISRQNSLAVNAFNEIDSDSQLDRLGARGPIPSDQSTLPTELYPVGTMPDTSLHYYQSGTTLGETGAFTTPSYHSMGNVYQQAIPYADQAGYPIAQPVPFPPVPSHSVLASDTYYSARPVPQIHQSSLPPQTNSASPGTLSSAVRDTRQPRKPKSLLGKRHFGMLSRRTSREDVQSDEEMGSPLSQASPDLAHFPQPLANGEMF